MALELPPPPQTPLVSSDVAARLPPEAVPLALVKSPKSLASPSVPIVI